MSRSQNRECVTGAYRRSLVVEVPESPGFFTNHHGTTRTRADVSTVLLRLMPMHHDLINRGES